MRLADLIQDPATGKLSFERVWANVAHIIASWAVVYALVKRDLDFVWVLSYLAVVGGSALAADLFRYRYNPAGARPAVAAEPAIAPLPAQPQQQLPPAQPDRSGALT